MTTNASKLNPISDKADKVMQSQWNKAFPFMIRVKNGPPNTSNAHAKNAEVVII